MEPPASMVTGGSSGVEDTVPAAFEESMRTVPSAATNRRAVGVAMVHVATPVLRTSSSAIRLPAAPSQPRRRPDRSFVRQVGAATDAADVTASADAVTRGDAVGTSEGQKDGAGASGGTVGCGVDARGVAAAASIGIAEGPGWDAAADTGVGPTRRITIAASTIRIPAKIASRGRTGVQDRVDRVGVVISPPERPEPAPPD